MRCKWLTLASPQPQGKPHLRSLFVQAACKIVQACCFKMTILICATPLTMRPVSHFLSLYRPLIQPNLMRTSIASKSACAHCTRKNSPHRCRLFSVFQISWGLFQFHHALAKHGSSSAQHLAAKAPLVVVPSQYFHHIAVRHFG